MRNIKLLTLAFCTMAMLPVKKKKIVFFGDSITQMGVNKGGYIDRIQQALNTAHGATQWALAGAGVGGNKVYDLYLRMEEDVLALKPHTVVIYVGINDVWHKTSGIGTDIEKYERFYTAMIKKMQAKRIRLALCTPTLIGEKKNGANPQDADLDAYSAVVRKLAVNHQCILIDLRAAFAAYEQQHNIGDQATGLLTTDGVHLTELGNQLVADEMMKALSIL